MKLNQQTGRKRIQERSKKGMKRLVISFIVAMALMIIPVSVALAVEDTVTVTALPSYVAISNAPNTWTLNDITGNGAIDSNTTYYSNPLGDTTAPAGATVVDGECYFTITNTSTLATNVVVDIEDFTGGSDPMLNSEDGTNGVGTFGAYSWYSGLTYPGSRVIAKENATGSENLYSGLAATTDLLWGMEVLTQSDAWAGGTSSTSTITITVTAA
ncbi:hypothetical protein ES703_108001 [subsurface metagenome]